MTILSILLSYVLGSIPTGLWLGIKLRGVDIRQHGSKNIGATNTMRVLGKPLGALALLGDMGKGVAAVLLISRLGSWEYLRLACGIAAVAGHTASVFLKFRGGKGVATGAGVFLALAPLPALVAGVMFIVVVVLTRMASAGSMSAAIALCVALYLTDPSWPIRITATLIGIWVIWLHRSNIQRILKGQENRLW